MLSVVILAVTALMISTNLSLSFTLTEEVQDVVKSTDLAQKYLEEVKAEMKYATNYDELSSGSPQKNHQVLLVLALLGVIQI